MAQISFICARDWHRAIGADKLRAIRTFAYPRRLCHFRLANPSWKIRPARQRRRPVIGDTQRGDNIQLIKKCFIRRRHVEQLVKVGGVNRRNIEKIRAGCSARNETAKPRICISSARGTWIPHSSRTCAVKSRITSLFDYRSWQSGNPEVPFERHLAKSRVWRMSEWRMESLLCISYT